MLGFSPLERIQRGMTIKAYRVMKAADEIKIILNSYHTRRAQPETFWFTLVCTLLLGN